MAADVKVGVFLSGGLYLIDPLMSKSTKNFEIFTHSYNENDESIYAKKLLENLILEILINRNKLKTHS